MKLIKYSVIMLVVAIISDVVISYAKAPELTYLTTTVSPNEHFYTGYHVKDTYSYQTYENTATFTWLTDPCDKCQIAAKPRDIDGNVYEGIVTVLGETKRFTDPTTVSSPNEYELDIWRFDFTLIKTTTAATWVINS